jgi:hypothetical protein
VDLVIISPLNKLRLVFLVKQESTVSQQKELILEILNVCYARLVNGQTAVLLFAISALLANISRSPDRVHVSTARWALSMAIQDRINAIDVSLVATRIPQG